MKNILILLLLVSMLVGCSKNSSEEHTLPDLWQVYQQTFSQCKYVDLTHAFHPGIPVWPGFEQAEFRATSAGTSIPGYVEPGDTFTIAKHGFIATSYVLPTDQYGTQLDPPAHWNPVGATISDLPPTYAIRPLVVIDIHQKVAANPGYHCGKSDILAWENQHGKIPEGAVVMVRSDWHTRWEETSRFNQKPFPGISLEALQFLHLQRNILFHGHESLDTDTTATLEGEAWLLNNHYCQAEGVANLDKVPEAGALVVIGFAKPLGGTGGFARYVAVCPPEWKHGVSLKENPGAPLPPQASTLVRNPAGVLLPSR